MSVTSYDTRYVNMMALNQSFLPKNCPAYNHRLMTTLYDAINCVAKFVCSRCDREYIFQNYRMIHAPTSNHNNCIVSSDILPK